MPKYPSRDKTRRPRVVRAKSSGELLQRITSGSALAAIQQSAVAIDALRQRLLAQLPEVLRAHVTGVIAKPGELVVFADSAAWASRLKLTLADAPPDLAPEVEATDRVTVRVMPTGEFRR